VALTLRIGQLNRPGQLVSVYRTFYPPGNRYPLHRHDFPELFFIESGRGAQIIGGRATALGPGDFSFVDAAAEHELAADDEEAMVLVNIAFSQRFADSLRPFIAPREWPWLAGQAPVRRLDAAQQVFVGEWIERLSERSSDRTALAAFILELVRRLRPLAAAPDDPSWLADVLGHLDRLEVLAGGVRALARIAGRGPDSLGRAVRRSRGCTTVALINRHRMEWFARQLRLTRRPIAELAAECGLANLSHCYRLFRAAHGCSPRRYRMRFHGGVTEG
jgi:AraC family cel operon transcriptional repressor